MESHPHLHTLLTRTHTATSRPTLTRTAQRSCSSAPAPPEVTPGARCQPQRASEPQADHAPLPVRPFLPQLSPPGGLSAQTVSVSPSPVLVLPTLFILPLNPTPSPLLRVLSPSSGQWEQPPFTLGAALCTAGRRVAPRPPQRPRTALVPLAVPAQALPGAPQAESQPRASPCPSGPAPTGRRSLTQPLTPSCSRRHTRKYSSVRFRGAIVLRAPAPSGSRSYSHSL